MLTTPVDYAAPAGAEVLGGDWFGDGSFFDSGEELAAALLALAAADRRSRVSLEAGPGEPPTPLPPPLPAMVAVAVSEPPPEPDDAPSLELVGEFQVAAMPSFRLMEPGIPAPASRDSSGWQPSSATLPPSPRPSRSAWSIRQSVQMLRTTEEILRRLREEAAELAWQMAAEVRREVDG